jgi:nucleoid DNA-binding protein
MTKKELINEMSKDLNSTKEAKAALESLLATITHALKNGDAVTLTGFGTFKVSERKARQGRNPRTGEKIKIKPKKIAQFVAGKSLKEAVN